MAQNAHKRDLTPKQSAFVGEYLKDLNGRQAAIRAGYSAKNAERIAHELLKETPHVAAAVQKAMDERSNETKINANTVLKNIERIAGKAEDVADFGAALKANELLGKHLKLFTDKLDVSGTITLEKLISGEEG